MRDSRAFRAGLELLCAGEDLTPPGLSPHAILVLRRLETPELTAGDERRVWPTRLRDHLSSLAARAARPALGRVDPSAEAVIFADLPELLAVLARDAAVGHDPWWWRTLYGGSARQVLPSRWMSHPAELPAALARLDGGEEGPRGAEQILARALSPELSRALWPAMLASRGLGGLAPRVARADPMLLANALHRPLVLPVEPESARLLLVARLLMEAPTLVEPRLSLALKSLITLPSPNTNPEGAPTTRGELHDARALLPLSERPAALRVAAPVVVPAPAAPTADSAPSPRAPTTAESPRSYDAIAAEGETFLALPQRPRTSPLHLRAPERGEPESAAPLSSPVGSLVVPEVPEPDSPHTDIHNEPFVPTWDPWPSLEAGLPLPDLGVSLGLATRAALITRLGGLLLLFVVFQDLELYPDFTRPLDAGFPIPAPELALEVARVLGGPLPDDPLVERLAAFAGDPGVALPERFVTPITGWRLFGLPSAWGVARSGAWTQLIHPDGGLIAELVTDRRDLRAVASGLGFEPTRVVEPVVLPEGLRERWIERIAGYARARLRLLGAVPDEEIAATLLWRPALVEWSDTTIDASFGLEEHPIAIRLSGLDRDPGWVPDLARSLRFRFV